MEYQNCVNLKTPGFAKIFQFFKISGMHISNPRHSRINAIGHLVYCVSSLLYLIYSLTVFITDRDKVVVILHHSLLGLDFLVMVVFNAVHREKVKYLVRGLEKCYNYDSPLMNAFIKPLAREKEISMEKIYKIITICPFLTFVNVVMFSFMEKYVWQVAEYILLYPVATSQLDHWFVYLLVIGWQVSYIIYLTVTIFGLLGYILVVHSVITMQFKILEHAILTTNDRIKEKTEKMLADKKLRGEEKKKLVEEISIKCTQDCARHHTDIISYFETARDCMRLIYLIIMGTGLFIFVCTGFTSISENQGIKFKFYGILIVQCCYLYTCCWVGESVAETSVSIRMIIYDMDWWLLPASCRMPIRLIMVRTMKPFYLETLMGQKVVLESYMDMVKGAYSYFNLMIQTNEK